MHAMEENLIGYLLHSLDKATHEQVEAYLRENSQAWQQLEQLREAMAPLEEDRDLTPGPPDLVIRTLARIAEQTCRDLPRLPRPTTRPAPVMRSFWRRADVLVAASLLLTVLGLGAPAVSQLRHHQARVECQSNLKEFYSALRVYYDQHGKLPNFAEKTPHNPAGLIAPLLKDSGVLSQTASVRCPANGTLLPVTLTVEQIQQLAPEKFEQEAPKLLPGYAYSLGYQDNAGYHFPNHSPRERFSSHIPLMADRPPQRLEGLNSPNHGGFGQNVLFHDGHIIFATVRNVGPDGDDIFLNRNRKVAPGIGPFDSVLGHSAAQPFLVSELSNSN
jgi:hypothetical protein